jgi:hypothetical protein
VRPAAKNALDTLDASLHGLFGDHIERVSDASRRRPAFQDREPPGPHDVDEDTPTLPQLVQDNEYRREKEQQQDPPNALSRSQLGSIHRYHR